jgi:hypothetical protein
LISDKKLKIAVNEYFEVLAEEFSHKECSNFKYLPVNSITIHIGVKGGYVEKLKNYIFCAFLYA